MPIDHFIESFARDVDNGHKAPMVLFRTIYSSLLLHDEFSKS